jgi:hypothetical protein
MAEQIINVFLENYDTFVCVISNEKELPTLEELIGRFKLEEKWFQNRI